MRFLLSVAALLLLTVAVNAQASAKAEAKAPAKPLPAAGGPVTVFVPAPACAAPAAIVHPVRTVAYATVNAGAGFFARVRELIHNLVPHRTVARSRAVTRTR